MAKYIHINQKGSCSITYKMKPFEETLKVLELHDPGYHENTNVPFSSDSKNTTSEIFREVTGFSKGLEITSIAMY